MQLAEPLVQIGAIALKLSETDKTHNRIGPGCYSMHGHSRFFTLGVQQLFIIPLLRHDATGIKDHPIHLTTVQFSQQRGFVRRFVEER